MSILVPGVVKNGVVVPSAPLPEGALVEIQVRGADLEAPPELREEFTAWQRGSTNGPEPGERSAAEKEPSRYPLRGSVVRYDQPTEPVADADWEALG